jgi:cytochrome c oxidase accessory protein FixG
VQVTAAGRRADVVRLVAGSSTMPFEYADEHNTFRNELASVATDGRRRWVYARQPSGPLYRARTIISVFLMAFLFLAPFITIHGQPLMLLDVLNRRFVLFSTLFVPQDFYLVVILALTVLVTIVLSTVIVGRIWCGWLCPQTIFMEMLFRKLEYAIEGSAEQQLRRDRGVWTVERLVRQSLKHSVFFALSFLIANVFLAWIIGAGPLFEIVTDPPSGHLVGLTAISIFSLTFYAVFVRFREQACVLACPYGRMLSSLVDRRTVTVTYDSRRGEPRSRIIRGDIGAQHAGDCIDCHRCVTVCPTGIDIRNGIQLECVACTACIDACDDVMLRIGRPTGLIRHTSPDAIANGGSTWLRTRVIAYAAVWILLVGSSIFLLSTRPDLDFVVLRQPGMLYATVAGGDLANFYTIEAMNRSDRPTPISIDVVEPAGATVTILGSSSLVPPYGALDARLLVRLPSSAVHAATTPVRFAVRSNGRTLQQIESAFLGPTPSARQR